MSEDKKRGIQTRVKHEILGEYLKKWGYIITSGIRGRFRQWAGPGRFLVRFVYVDGFASSGIYPPEDDTGNPVFGSPVIGINALDALRNSTKENIGFEPEIYVILVERDKVNFAKLIETLKQANFGDRIVETDKLTSLSSQQIALLNADITDCYKEILDFTQQQYTWSFYLLDPFGPSGIPLSMIGNIIRQEHVDVMINFPYYDLGKKTGSAARDTSAHEQHMVYFDKMYNSQEWREVAGRYYNEENEARKTEMEGDLVDLYHRSLQEQDASLAIKSIRLKFPTIERTMFYLFLTTHDPNGALALNEILDEADQRQFELRENHKHPGQMRMFPDAENPLKYEPEIGQIADEIFSNWHGKETEFIEILRSLSDKPYHLGHIKRAMTQLKRRNQADFESNLRNSSRIKFQ